MMMKKFGIYGGYISDQTVFEFCYKVLKIVTRQNYFKRKTLGLRSRIELAEKIRKKNTSVVGMHPFYAAPAPSAIP
jgi:hypothetical protein